VCGLAVTTQQSRIDICSIVRISNVKGEVSSRRSINVSKLKEKRAGSVEEKSST
jgi:hypothetical protein